MAIQNTSLDMITIKELIKSSYGLSAIDVNTLPVGTANCFKIKTDNGQYFLKEYPTDFPAKDIEQEVSLNDYIILHKFPTAKIIRTLDNTGFVSSNGRYIILQEFIEGKNYIKHDLPDEYLMQAAELLGQLHLILSDYDMPTEMDEHWCNKFNAAKAEKMYDVFFEQMENFKSDKFYLRIKDDLMFKKSLMKIIEPYGKYIIASQYKSTHGDYSAMQFICGCNGIKAVIDFASAKKLPAAWEIMRSYMQSAIDTKNPFDFNCEKFCEYIRRYMKYSTLSKNDLKYMPYIYLYQLGRSNYGYKEYLITQTENKYELLNFAFWCTDVCRMLAQNADNISDMLVNHYNLTLHQT